MPTINEMVEKIIGQVEKAIASYLKVERLPEFLKENYSRVPEEERLNYLGLVRDFSIKSRENPFIPGSIVGMSYNFSELLRNTPEQRQDYYRLMLSIVKGDNVTPQSTGLRITELLRDLPKEQRKGYLEAMIYITTISRPHDGGYIINAMAEPFGELLKISSEQANNYLSLMFLLVSNKGIAKRMARPLAEMLQEYTFDSVQRFVEEGKRVGYNATIEFYNGNGEQSQGILVKK